MGVDIHGWVEVKPDYYDVDPEWVPIIPNVGFLVGTLLLADEAVERAAAPEPVKQGLERRGWR